MSGIDVEILLAEVAPESPCGDDLEYDAAFGELERTAQFKPEQQIGETIVPAEEPDWREVKRQAVELFSRTKDLRVGSLLVRALIRTDGLTGFASGAQLLRGLIEKYWDGVHPRLDPEDDNDPTLRVNTLSALCDADAALKALRDTPIVSSRTVGRYCLRDVMIVNGEYPAPAGAAPPEKGAIDAAFMDVPLEELQATLAAVQATAADLKAAQDAMTAQVGVFNSVQFSPVLSMLTQIEKTIAEPLARRQPAAETNGEAVNGESNGAAAVQRLAGEIVSREDVIRAIDKICDYYDRHEPSSPVPLLLKRAKRLAAKSFMDIIRDLTPEGLAQAMSIGGLVESEQ
jgi:type VI secretion system protein ImpA